MQPAPITVEQIILFANERAGAPLWTLARRSPFTIRTGKKGIRYELPSGSYWPINRSVIAKYLRCYYAASPESRTKTTIYPPELRERSYMASILFELEKEQRGKHYPQQNHEDGLDDLDDTPEGNDCPDRAKSTSYRVIRDPKVRAYILEHARGKCEYCRKMGFLMRNGRRYLEPHHIIALSKHGKDTVDNVIALCPAHHREAHYGEAAESLEREFLVCIRKRKW